MTSAEECNAVLKATLAKRPLEVGLLLFPDVEVLDFAGPFEVFSVAARIHAEEGRAPFRVSTVSNSSGSVVARHGLSVNATYDFHDCPDYDLLIVPGGVVSEPMENAETLSWIGQMNERSILTASVCTGAFLLAKLGLLDGRKATTHWEDIADLRAQFPKVTVLEDVPYVDEGRLLSSAGISAGIGMSLYIVSRILGDAAARKSARQMQYDWP